MATTTTISRQALIDTIDQTFKDHDARWVEYNKALEEYRKQHQQDWLDEYQPKIRKLRDLFSVNLKYGSRPVYRKEVIAILGDIYVPVYSPPSGANFTWNNRSYWPPTLRMPDDLKALRETLQAMQEDAVSPNLLKTLGFKDLAWVYRNAIANQSLDKDPS